MIITHQYVKDKFYEYNGLMFESKFFAKLRRKLTPACSDKDWNIEGKARNLLL